MASRTPFELACAHTLGIEGGYVDDPRDRGGATRWGITEAVARTDGYTGPMSALPQARALAIYRRLYWDRIGLDWVAAVAPQVALEVFDTGVNMGVIVAGRFLQRVLNALNRRGTDYPDLVVDGIAGPATAKALRAFIQLRGGDGLAILLRYLNALQGAAYIELAEGRQANEAFVLGWGRRLDTIVTDQLKEAA